MPRPSVTVRPPLFWPAIFGLGLVLVLAGPAAAKKEPKGVFAGKVLNQQEEPLPGTVVTVASLDPAGFRGEVTADKKGEFSLSVPNATGEYQLRLVKEGYAPYEKNFLLEAGDEQNIVFRLLDAATGRREEAKAAYNQGVGVFNSGDRAAAKERFKAAVALDPELPEPHRGLADIYLGEGDAAAALRHADKYLETYPDDRAVLEIAYRAAGLTGDSARVEELRPRLQDAGGKLARTAAVDVYNQGARAVQAQDLELALAKLKSAVEIDPDLVPAWSVLASIHYNREEYESALAAVDELLRREPANVEGLRYRYLVHDTRGESQAAAEAFEAYAAADAKAAAATLYRRADLDFGAGDVAAAREALERVIVLDPALARAYYTLGLSYAATDAGKAKENLRKFLDLAPEDPEAGAAREILSQL